MRTVKKISPNNLMSSFAVYPVCFYAFEMSIRDKIRDELYGGEEDERKNEARAEGFEDVEVALCST